MSEGSLVFAYVRLLLHQAFKEIKGPLSYGQCTLEIEFVLEDVTVLEINQGQDVLVIRVLGRLGNQPLSNWEGFAVNLIRLVNVGEPGNIKVADALVGPNGLELLLGFRAFLLEGILVEGESFE